MSFCIIKVVVIFFFLDLNPFVFVEPKNDATFSFIIGGDKTEPGEYPYFVEIRISNARDTRLCGGSLIGPDIVLSAAHCAGENARYSVYVGSYRFGTTEEGSELRACKEWINDPKYDAITFEYDFALCKLDAPVDIDQSNVILELNADNSIPRDGEDLVVMGFGYVVLSEKRFAEYLQSLEEPYISNEKCNREEIYNGQVSDEMLCAGFLKGGRGQCLGDSGGPLIQRKLQSDGTMLNIQVGIVSWSEKNNDSVSGCALQNRPGVFARISSRIDWIRTTSCTDLNSIASFCNSSKKPKKSKTKKDKNGRKKMKPKRVRRL